MKLKYIYWFTLIFSGAMALLALKSSSIGFGLLFLTIFLGVFFFGTVNLFKYRASEIPTNKFYGAITRQQRKKSFKIISGGKK